MPRLIRVVAPVLAIALAATLPGEADAKRNHPHAHAPAASVQLAGGPPPWAPAHGYRRKHGGPPARVIAVPTGAPTLLNLDVGRCYRETAGQILGGATGAILGAQVGTGSGRVAAVAAGTLIGFLVGGEIGRYMDSQDALCAGYALEHVPDGRAVAWQNPDLGHDVQMTPQRTYEQRSGEYCREYTMTSTVDGRPVETWGTACRQPDGQWRITD